MPIWRRDPPCEAHKVLNQIFLDHKIEPCTQPKKIYDSHPAFKPYTLNVFRQVFNQLKGIHGINCKNISIKYIFILSLQIIFDTFIIFFILVKRPNDLLSIEGAEPSSKRSKTSESPDDDTDDVVEDLDAQIIHHNQPVMMSVYRDPDTEEERVIIVASLPGGSTDIEFSLVGSGPGTRTARIEYRWPSIAYNIEEIFAKEIANKIIPSCHPKILALKADLQNTRDCIDEAPKGMMELSLPISVQTVANSVKRMGKVKENGSLTLIVELSAYQNAYTVKQEDKKVVFEKV